MIWLAIQILTRRTQLLKSTPKRKGSKVNENYKRREKKK